MGAVGGDLQEGAFSCRLSFWEPEPRPREAALRVLGLLHHLKWTSRRDSALPRGCPVRRGRKPARHRSAAGGAGPAPSSLKSLTSLEVR